MEKSEIGQKSKKLAEDLSAGVGRTAETISKQTEQLSQSNMFQSVAYVSTSQLHEHSLCCTYMVQEVTVCIQFLALQVFIEIYGFQLPENLLTCTHTHTQPCNGPLSGSTWVSWYQKKDSPTRTHPVHQSHPYQLVLDWVRHFRPIPIHRFFAVSRIRYRFFDTASRADVAPRDWQIKGSRRRRRN